MSLTLKYIDAPEGVQEKMLVSSDSGQPALGSEDGLRTGFADTACATLEPQGWPLDGSRTLLQEDPAESVGWWSQDRSEEDGRFQNPPSIRFFLSENSVFSTPGITFRFWPSMGQWCSEIRVTWYYTAVGEDGSGYKETVLDQVLANPDAPEWFLSHAVKDFNMVEIELLATNIPGQFAKLQHIQIGRVIVFPQNELSRVILLNEIDLSSCELSVDTLTVDIVDEQGRSLRPRKRQKVQLYKNDRLIASHFLTSAEQKSQKAYTFRCHSAIGQLDGTFMGGVYKDKMLSALLDEVLSGFSYENSATPLTQKVTGYIPVCTRRQALQQIAFAVGAVVSTSGDGVIRLLPLQTDVSGTFSRKDIFTGAMLTQDPTVTAVQILSHEYSKSEETEVLLDNVELSGVRLFTFDQPHHSYEWENPPQGASMDTGENWLRITISNEPVSVRVTAKKYNHTTSVWERRNESAEYDGPENIVRVENATLINSGNVDAALDRLMAYRKLKDTLTQTVIISGQKIGDLTESINPWGTITAGYITSMESEFTGSGHTAAVKILGSEKDAAEAEVLTV